MEKPSVTKRQLLKTAGTLGAVSAGLAGGTFLRAEAAQPAATAEPDLLSVADGGWALWIDHDAKWQSDKIYLPADVPPMASLPVNPPTGGWDTLYKGPGVPVTLPTTVEEHCWGQFGLKPYAADEYKYAGKEDPTPQNGAYVGVSWWWKPIDIPASAKGHQVWLHLRGARFRAEVYLNEKLVGYSIMSELPFDCDLTAATVPGGPNRLAIRITNPGGTYDWRDYTSLQWGEVRFYPGHGFGGLDRGLSLSVHPAAGRISDAWVLNTPEPRTVTAYVELDVNGKASPDALGKQITVAVADTKGTPVAADVALLGVEAKDGRVTARFKVRAASAQLWDLDTPNLYRLTVRWSQGKEASRKTVRFGFRWYSIDGLGKNALLRLNGRRIKLYSAISWGFWGYNGLWPRPELARREVTSAKALGLNSLSFHRNLGRREVLDAQDEMGLTRTMEPGAGEHAIGRLPKPGQTLSVAEAFDRDFMSARCEAMVKAFRSHPSLLQYTLQNEIVGDLSNPGVERILRLMHAADPSRTVILDDGFNARGDAQAMMMPYSDHYYRSDAEAFPAAGWWGQHQNAGDQWYDRFYVSKDSFVHRQTIADSIVELGEMQGCAVCDNHVKMIADIIQHGGKSYDLQDHQEVVAAYNTFLDKWGFRKAFPTTEGLFLSIGAKQYGSWHQYLENIRISDQVDMTAISGWETTAIENHSGIVDNLRYFHGDPNLLKSSLLPVRPVAKQRALTYAVGEAAALDIWLLNDTAKPVDGALTLSVTSPDGRTAQIATYAAPANVPDQFSYLLAENVAVPAFTSEGKHQIRLELSGHADATFARDVWVVNTAIKPFKTTPRIALSGVSHAMRVKLAKIDGVTFEDFQAGKSYDGILTSGLSAQEITERQAAEVSVGDPKPKTAAPPGPPGEIAPDVLAAVKAGTPLLVMAPEERLADGIAKQLTALGLFSYAGQVGAIRASWMGSWHFLRSHALFDGIPADMAANNWHQVPAGGSNGLLIDGDGIEIAAAYSRDHDRQIGASSFTVRKNGMKLVFHRMPDMAAPLQKRWIINAVHWLTDKA